MDEVDACFVCDVGELWQGLGNGVKGEKQRAAEDQHIRGEVRNLASGTRYVIVEVRNLASGTRCVIVEVRNLTSRV